MSIQGRNYHWAPPPPFLNPYLRPCDGDFDNRFHVHHTARLVIQKLHFMPKLFFFFLIHPYAFPMIYSEVQFCCCKPKVQMCTEHQINWTAYNKSFKQRCKLINHLFNSFADQCIISSINVRYRSSTSDFDLSYIKLKKTSIDVLLRVHLKKDGTIRPYIY
jgi:hypothetical protein